MKKKQKKWSNNNDELRGQKKLKKCTLADGKVKARRGKKKLSRSTKFKRIILEEST